MRLAKHFISFFCNKFNKFNDTGGRTIDSIYHRTSKLLRNHIFGEKTLRFCHLLRNIMMDIIT